MAAHVRIQTQRFWRNRLPHWEVVGGTYFVTLRCAGSLPRAAEIQLRNLRKAWEKERSDGPAHDQLERQIFRLGEKYLDAGFGLCPFGEGKAAGRLREILTEMESPAWRIPHGCIMPNHVHLVVHGTEDPEQGLGAFMRILKGRSARELNLLLKRAGIFWQRDWFDRWMRSEGELRKTIDYIRQNPVKAGLAVEWRAYPHTWSEAGGD